MKDKPIPIRISQDLLGKIKEAARLSGLPQQDVMRLAMRIGLVKLKMIGYDIEGKILDAAEATNVVQSGINYSDVPDIASPRIAEDPG